MTDLDIVIKVSALARLRNIANCAAVVALEFDPYISLAFYVEQYLDSPTNEALGMLHEHLTICAKKYPDFKPYHTVLVEELKINGNLSDASKKEPTLDTEDKVEPTTKPWVSPSKLTSSVDDIISATTPKNNIINLFGKKTVDNPDKS